MTTFPSSPPEEPVYTFRDRVKFACLHACVEAGLDEEAMIEVFRAATKRLRSPGEKTAAFGWAGPAASSLGYLALLGIPVATLSSAALGNVLGRTARNVRVGRLPTKEEINLLDEIAAYHRTADEVNARTEEEMQERQQRSKPSVRRLF